MSKSVEIQSQDLTKRYTLGEEIFNSVSHGAGGLLSIAGTAVLIVLAAIYSNAWGVVSSAIFGASLIILYTMSTLYHAITNPKAKKFFRIMDHNTIFLPHRRHLHPYHPCAFERCVWLGSFRNRLGCGYSWHCAELH